MKETICIFLFNDFQTLDAMGPIDILGDIEDFELQFISFSGGMIKSAQGFIIQTEKMNPEQPVFAILIPGGMGVRSLLEYSGLLEALKQLCLNSKWVLSVCTGSGVLAQIGLLDNKRATTNKKAFDYIQNICPKVTWVRKARWVVDGNTWTSSGVSAGIDMTLAFIKDQKGHKTAIASSTDIEYIWNEDPENDSFADE